jgi:hypothetical protein
MSNTTDEKVEVASRRGELLEMRLGLTAEWGKHNTTNAPGLGARAVSSVRTLD